MKHITVQKLYNKITTGLNGAQLIDVRTPEEFNQVAIPQAKNIPLTQLAGHLTELKQSPALYIVCQSGGRSRVAALMLAAVGCKAIYNVIGGTAAWMAAQFPVAK